MKLSIRPVAEDQQQQWNNFVESNDGGTLFHRLDFLAYHGKRFRRNEHHLVFYNGDTVCGVLPLAIFEEEGRRVGKSSYGASYGGPVFDRVLTYADSMHAIAALLDYLHSLDVARMQLTLPLAGCYSRYSETFRLALLEHGFTAVNRDISSVVRLDRRQDLNQKLTSRARNMVRKAYKAGVKIQRGGCLDDFWPVLRKTYDKLGLLPTHQRDEFAWLMRHLPTRVVVDVAFLHGRPVAGIGHFIVNQHMDSAFYLCQDPMQQQTQALSFLIHASLLRCQQEGFTWFDFGTSSVNQKGRENLFRFKESFGAVGQFRETYHWEQS